MKRQYIMIVRPEWQVPDGLSANKYGRLAPFEFVSGVGYITHLEEGKEARFVTSTLKRGICSVLGNGWLVGRPRLHPGDLASPPYIPGRLCVLRSGSLRLLSTQGALSITREVDSRREKRMPMRQW